MTALLSESVRLNLYQLTYESMLTFKDQIDKTNKHKIIDALVSQIGSNGHKYGMKLMLMLQFIPFMTKTHAKHLMNGFENILNSSGKDSIFKLNVNPFRIGLILYHTIRLIRTTASLSIRPSSCTTSFRIS